MAYLQFVIAVPYGQLRKAYEENSRKLWCQYVQHYSPLLIAAIIFSNCLYIEHGSQGYKRLNRNLTPLLKHSDLLVCCGTDSAISCYSFFVVKNVI